MIGESSGWFLLSLSCLHSSSRDFADSQGYPTSCSRSRCSCIIRHSADPLHSPTASSTRGPSPGWPCKPLSLLWNVQIMAVSTKHLCFSAVGHDEQNHTPFIFLAARGNRTLSKTLLATSKQSVVFPLQSTFCTRDKIHIRGETYSPCVLNISSCPRSTSSLPQELLLLNGNNS